MFTGNRTIKAPGFYKFAGRIVYINDPVIPYRKLARNGKAYYISSQIQLMKSHLRSSLLVVTIFIALPSLSQLDATTAFGLGKGIAGKVKDSKKKKNIDNSFSVIQLNGKNISVLRVPADKILSNAKAYVIKVQDQLDAYRQTYQLGKHLTFPSYYDDITMIRSLDSEWPAEQYENELKEYRYYDQQLLQQENNTRDSLQIVERRREQEVKERLALAHQKALDSTAYADRVKGYHFINREFSLLREKPNTTSKVIGRIYVGSYVRVIGYSDGSPFVKISLQNISGYIDQSELVDDLDRLSVDNADLAIYKVRQYYKYIPNYDYVPEQEQTYAVPLKTSPTRPKQTTTIPKKQSNSSSRNYIRGPRGGCYYMSSNNTKVYVDRGLCQ
jgi:hypothetical protein